MSLLKPILRPALRSTLSSIVGAIRRYFTDFDPVSQTYVQLSSPIVLAGDFEIEIQAQWTPIASESLVGFISDSSGTQERVGFFGPNSSVSARDNSVEFSGGFFQGALAGVDNSTLNEIKFARSGSTIELFINGVSKGTITRTGNVVFNLFGCWWDFTRHWDGIIANVKIQDTGTTVLDMPLDGSDYESNTTVIDKSPSGNNGTAFNFAAADTELYTLQNGAWVSDTKTIPVA